MSAEWLSGREFDETATEGILRLSIAACGRKDASKLQTPLKISGGENMPVNGQTNVSLTVASARPYEGFTALLIIQEVETLDEPTTGTVLRSLTQVELKRVLGHTSNPAINSFTEWQYRVRNTPGTKLARICTASLVAYPTVFHLSEGRDALHLRSHVFSNTGPDSITIEEKKVWAFRRVEAQQEATARPPEIIGEELAADRLYRAFSLLGHASVLDEIAA